MRGNAVVQMSYDKKRKYKKWFIYIPANIVNGLGIEKGHILDFDMNVENLSIKSDKGRGMRFKRTPLKAEDQALRNAIHD